MPKTEFNHLEFCVNCRRTLLETPTGLTWFRFKHGGYICFDCIALIYKKTGGK